MSLEPARDHVLRLARERGVLAAREVGEAGLHREILTRLVREGSLERVGRGLYRIPDLPMSEHHGLVLAARAIPQGVICLLSALSFHEIGTQLPHEVWMAIERRSRRPTVQFPPTRFVRFSGPAFSEGIETHTFEGQPLRVYSSAKTVADVFKYRNKLGLDVALEALREGWSGRRFALDEIEHYARICRVGRVIRPYLEALVS